MDDLKGSEAHQRFRGSAAYKRDPDYYDQDGEVFARWFPQWVEHEAGRAGLQIPEGVRDWKAWEKYSDAELQQTGRLFAAAIGRYGLHKAYNVAAFTNYGDGARFDGFREASRPGQASRRAQDEAERQVEVFDRGLVLRARPHYHGSDGRLYRCAHGGDGRMILQPGDEHPTWVSRRRKGESLRAALHAAQTPYWEKAWKAAEIVLAPTRNSAAVASRGAKEPGSEIALDREGRIRVTGPAASRVASRIRGRLDRMETSEAYVGSRQDVHGFAGFRLA